MTTIECPACGKSIGLSEKTLRKYAGKKAKCPACRNVIEVPFAAQALPVLEEDDDLQKARVRNRRQRLIVGVLIWLMVTGGFIWGMAIWADRQMASAKKILDLEKELEDFKRKVDREALEREFREAEDLAHKRQ
jgi:hypothetical protein